MLHPRDPGRQDDLRLLRGGAEYPGEEAQRRTPYSSLLKSAVEPLALAMGSVKGYKGVHWETAKARWVASIGVNGRTYRLGRFKTPEEAAMAYNWAALRFFGEFAVLNEIPPAS